MHFSKPERTWPLVEVAFVESAEIRGRVFDYESGNLLVPAAIAVDEAAEQVSVPAVLCVNNRAYLFRLHAQDPKRFARREINNSIAVRMFF